MAWFIERYKNMITNADRLRLYFIKWVNGCIWSVGDFKLETKLVKKKAMIVAFSSWSVFIWWLHLFIIYLVCNYLYMQVYSQALESNCSKIANFSESPNIFLGIFGSHHACLLQTIGLESVLPLAFCVLYFPCLVLISLPTFAGSASYTLVLRLSFLTFVLSALICTRSYLAIVIRWLQNLFLSFFLQLRLLFFTNWICLSGCLIVSKNFQCVWSQSLHLGTKFLVLVVSLAVYCHSSTSPSLVVIRSFTHPFPIYLGTKVCILTLLTKFG